MNNDSLKIKQELKCISTKKS